MAALLVAGLVGVPSRATGAAATPPPAAETKPLKASEPTAADKLALEEQRIADKYKHLEDVLLRMAELNAATDPRRAALLRKAVEQSKDRLVGVRFERLVELLGKDQLSRAMENQTELDQDLRALLELLMSENREKSLKSQKERIREYLKRIGEIIAQQNGIQGRTAGGDDPKRLAGDQANLAGKTGKLADDIRKNEEGKVDDKNAKGGSKDSKGDGKQAKDADKVPKGDGKQAKGEGKNAKGESKDSQGEGKDGKSGGKQSKDAGKNSQGEAQDSPSDGSDQAQQQDQSGNPARKRLQAAQQRMKEAEEALKKTQLDPAGKKEEEARTELEKAKAELEEILRQLRQEEVERMLAMLEARFRKMLQMQEEVYEGTLRLDKVPSAERTHNHEIESSRLSGRETQIVVEIDKALSVLRDEGSAVAFLEAAEQIREDMQQVVQRLAQAKVGKTTQDIEEDVMDALKEIIDALKKAQKDQQNKKKPPRQQSGEPQDPPLVDTLGRVEDDPRLADAGQHPHEPAIRNWSRATTASRPRTRNWSTRSSGWPSASSGSIASPTTCKRGETNEPAKNHDGAVCNRRVAAGCRAGAGRIGGGPGTSGGLEAARR